MHAVGGLRGRQSNGALCSASALNCAVVHCARPPSEQMSTPAKSPEEHGVHVFTQTICVGRLEYTKYLPPLSTDTKAPMLLVRTVAAPAIPTQEPLQAPRGEPVAGVEAAWNVPGAHVVHVTSALGVAAAEK